MNAPEPLAPARGCFNAIKIMAAVYAALFIIATIGGWNG